MSIFRSLHYRPFALLWAGQTISRLGDTLYTIALAWWVLQKTGSAVAMGTVLAFTLTPMLIFLLIGGVLVDRLPRRRVMIASDLLSGAVVMCIAFLAFANLLEIWHVYIASAIFGFVSAFFEPAYIATVPEITPNQLLPSANSLTSLSGQIVRVFGPSIGAAVIAAGGTSIAFGVNSLSFFVSAACLAFMPVPVKAFSAAPTTSIVSDLRAGFATVLGIPWLWITIVIAALGNVTSSGPFAVSMPFLVERVLNASVGALGLISSSVGAGAVVGAIWLGRSTHLRRRGLIAYGALVLGGAMVCVFGLPVGLLGWLAAAFVFGAHSSFFGLIWTNTLQDMVPREQLGRVSSIDFLGSFILLPVGYALAGWATDRLGPQPVFLIGGLLSALLALGGLAHPAIRNLD